MDISLYFLKRTFLIVACTLLSKLFPPVYCNLPQALNATSSFPSLGLDFQKVTVSIGGGDVFLGATNHIYQLTSDLQILDEQSSLIFTSSLDCSGEPPCLYPSEINNKNSVLLIDYDKEFLIACGTAFNGTCVLHNLDRISRVVSRVNNPKKVELNSLGLGRTVVTFLGNVPRSEEQGYYIGATFDDSQPYDGIHQHAVSTKKLVQSEEGEWTFEYGFENPSLLRYTYIDILEDFRTNFKVDYIYGFNLGNFSYFLTVQREDIYSQNYVTRIIRICTQDKSYYSYIEMDVVCRSRTKRPNKAYNLLQAAFVSPAGSTLAGSLELSPFDEVLYGVFTTSEESSNVPISDSALCVFPLKAITQKFTRGLTTCFIEHTGSQGLRFFSSNDYPCSYTSTGRTTSDDFCGTGELHPLEMGTKIISRDFLLGGGEDFHFTSLAVSAEEEDTIAIMGTSDGHLLKFIVDPLVIDGVQRTFQSKPFKHLILDTPGPVLQDMPFDAHGENLYVLTTQKLYKIAVSSCDHYVDCSACVSTHDPNNCGWCGGSCTTEAECLASGRNVNWDQHICSPAIFQVEPTTAPLTGGTVVTIVGDNLGYRVGEGIHLVSLAGEPCSINLTASNLHKFVCTAPDVSSLLQGNVDVYVKVSDPEGGFDIKGNATSPPNYEFTFAEPSITSFHPQNGPSLGGTILSIRGNYLNAGNSQTVTVADRPCVLVSVDANLLVCTTSEGPENSQGIVSVTFDTYTTSSREEFTYTEDPLIINFQPDSSTLSGGFDVQIEGSNLQLVQTMSIILSIPSRNMSFQEKCTVTSEHIAVCVSPDLSTSGITPDASNGFIVDVIFQINGIDIPSDKAFTLYPDPVVTQFEEKVVLTAGSSLTVTGLNFEVSDELPEPMILVGGRLCEVVYVSDTQIRCSLPALPSQDKEDQGYLVEVKMGNFEEDVGFVVVLPGLGITFIVILVVAIVVIICLVLLLIFLIKMKRVKTESHEETPIDLPTVEFASIAAPNGDTTALPPSPPVPNTYLRHPSHQDSPDIVIGGAAASESVPLLERIPKEIAMQISDVLVHEDNLTLGDVLGRGHFGCVYEGRYFQDGEEMHVAVKSLLRGATSDISAFLKEGIIMKDFNHPNVLALIGVCITRDNQPLVILPFMANGDLLSYVRDSKNELTMRQLLHFCRQIAEGMAYLSSLKFVHRDLAARNCMLDEKGVAKVADFGLSRDIYERDYYSGKDKTIKLPVRWMALECLERNIYNTKTDVWSYGVVMWEILTRGMNPYPSVDNWDLTSFLQRGRRLPQPDHCPDHVFQVMLSTWSVSSVDRPSFAMLVQQLNEILEEKSESPQNNQFDQIYINIPGADK